MTGANRITGAPLDQPKRLLLGRRSILALREAQVSLERGRVELRVDGVNLDGYGVRVKFNDAIDLELIAPDARCPPSPTDFITVAENAQSLDHRQRRGLELAIDVGLLAWVGGLAQLLERRVSSA